MIIGASATGKSTLTRTLAGDGAEEHEVGLNVTEKGRRREVKSPYVLGAKIAVAGNLKNTSDKISAMDALYQTIDHCWKHRDIVIADPYRCTHKQVRWLEQHPLRPAVANQSRVAIGRMPLVRAASSAAVPTGPHPKYQARRA